MPDQIVITEKASQAKGVRTAVGSRYGSVLAAEGHLLDLLEPGDVVPDGSNGHRFSFDRTDFTAPDRQAEATKRPSSRQSTRLCGPPSAFGLPPIATAKVS